MSDVIITPKTELKVVLPARFIPDNSVVTKCGGTYKFRLFENFKVYYPEDDRDKPPVDLVLMDGNRILVAEGEGRPNINIIKGDTELVWYIPAGHLMTHLIRFCGKPQ